LKTKRMVGATLATLALGCGVFAATGVPTYARTTQPALTIDAQETGMYAAKNFNPFNTNNLAGTIGMLYEPMFFFNTISSKVWPLLGTSYSWLNHGTVLDVKLRKSVKWSDGKSFSADDVIFTFSILKKNPATDVNGIWKQLKSITKVNANEVRFNFNQSNVPFAYYILQSVNIVPQHIFSKVKGDITKFTNPNPVGTGPMVLDSFSSQIYYMRANPHYWGGKPKVERIAYAAYNGNESANLALANGAIQWGGLFIPNIQKLYVSKDPAHRHYWFPPSNNVMLYTNFKDANLANLAVRKAISLAIDRTKLSKIAEYGYEQVAHPTGLIMPNQKDYLAKNLPAADTKFTYDKAAAVKLLTDAGYTRDSQDSFFKDKNGNELKYTINVVAGWTDWDEMADMIARNLQAIGINASVHEMQFADYLAAMQNHTFQLAICWSASGPSPFYFYDGLMNPNNLNNFEVYKDAKATAALNEFNHATTKAVQMDAAGKLERIVAEQLPSIPLVNGAVWYEYDTTHYTGWPTANNPYVDPAPWTYPATGIVITHLKPVQ
jgi:peptide/nickel transport system substrate-binding protein